MNRCIKSLMVLTFFLGVGTASPNAGTYVSKENPQHSVQYEDAPNFYITVQQCKNYSRQKYPDVVVRCGPIFSRHFYLNGEIVDGRINEIAKTQADADGFLLLFAFVLFIIAFYVYFLPTHIAYKRHHPQRFIIMMLNLFLGNTFIGWIAALIWARSGGDERTA